MATRQRTSNLKVPTIQLAECTRQLAAINENVFALKMGATNLIEAVERGDLNTARWIIESANLKQIIDNLTTKE